MSRYASTRQIAVALLIVAGLVAIGILVLLGSWAKSNRAMLHGFGMVSLGDSRAEIEKVLSEARSGPRLRRHVRLDWDRYRVGTLDEWTLLVHYADGYADLIGISSTDILGRRPAGAPPWKIADTFRQESMHTIAGKGELVLDLNGR